MPSLRGEEAPEFLGFALNPAAEPAQGIAQSFVFNALDGGIDHGIGPEGFVGTLRLGQ
jgi:hypothetical protein